MIDEEFTAKKREIEFRDKNWQDFRGSLYRNVVEFSFIPKQFSKAPSNLILDAGAGAGRFTEIMARNGGDVIALDFSKEQLRINRSHCRCQAVVADLCYLPFRSQVFDKAAALSVFQLIPNKEGRLAGLKEIKRVVRKGGIFLIHVYNYRPLLDSWVNKKEGFYKTSPPVYYYRSGFREFQGWLKLVFKKIVSMRGILVLYPVMKASRLENSPSITRIALFLERAFQRTFLPIFFGDFIAALCEV